MTKENYKNRVKFRVDMFSSRVQSCLQNKSIESLDELAKYSRRDLRKWKNLGLMSILEIENMLGRFGFWLVPDQEPLPVPNVEKATKQILQRDKRLKTELARIEDWIKVVEMRRDGLSWEKIARRFKLSVATVQIKLREARKAAERHLNPTAPNNFDA